MTVLDGAGRAMRALQSGCGLTGGEIDGAWGPTTQAAATAIAADRDRLMRAADRMLDWAGSLPQFSGGSSEAGKISQRLAQPDRRAARVSQSAECSLNRW
jgi:hypothetical protein